MYQCEACARAGVASPAILLHAERLRYLRLLVSNGPDVLWALLKLDPTGYEPLQQAVVWLYSRVRLPSYVAAPAVDWASWVAFIRDCPGQFKGAIRRGLHLDAVCQRCLAAFCRLHRQLPALQGSDLRASRQPALSELSEACLSDRFRKQNGLGGACLEAAWLPDQGQAVGVWTDLFGLWSGLCQPAKAAAPP